MLVTYSRFNAWTNICELQLTIFCCLFVTLAVAFCCYKDSEFVIFASAAFATERVLICCAGAQFNRIAPLHVDANWTSQLCVDSLFNSYSRFHCLNLCYFSKWRGLWGLGFVKIMDKFSIVLWAFVLRRWYIWSPNRNTKLVIQIS